MRLNRLLEMTTLLLNRSTVSAATLAERFGVSVRTIYRDVEALSASGVPVYTTVGAKGGISILPEYAVGRAMLTERERSNILFSLKALAATQYPDLDTAMEKLGGLFRADPGDWIRVDFSPWGASPNTANKFGEIKSAILECRVVEFTYVDVQNRRSLRRVEPLTMWFKHNAWYVSGYDLDRADMRTFRLSRVRAARATEARFVRDRPRPLPEAQPLPPSPPPEPVRCLVRFDKSVYSRLLDDFDDSLFEELPNGDTLLRGDFAADEWFFSYLLGYGAKAELLEPRALREELRRRAEKICELYRNPDT